MTANKTQHNKTTKTKLDCLRMLPYFQAMHSDNFRTSLSLSAVKGLDARFQRKLWF
jgi:hypothetical protein